MNLKRNLAIMFCLLALPAGAQTSVTVEETTKTVTPSSTAVETKTTETTVTTTTTAKSELYIVTIDTRRRELEKLIGEGMSNGKLTQAQADELRAELDEVTKLEIAAQKRGSAIPYVEIAAIATRIDVLGQRVTEIIGVPWTPIITNGQFVFSNGEIVKLDVIAARRAELEGKIAISLAHHILKKSQAAVLRKQLDDIAAIEVTYRHGSIDGQFSDIEARKLFQAFDRVGSKLDQFIASNKGKPVTGVY